MPRKYCVVTAQPQKKKELQISNETATRKLKKQTEIKQTNSRRAGCRRSESRNFQSTDNPSRDFLFTWFLLLSFLFAGFCLVCSQTRTAHPAGHQPYLLSIFQIILIATVWKIELCLREKEKKSYRRGLLCRCPSSHFSSTHSFPHLLCSARGMVRYESASSWTAWYTLLRDGGFFGCSLLRRHWKEGTGFGLTSPNKASPQCRYLMWIRPIPYPPVWQTLAQLFAEEVCFRLPVGRFFVNSLRFRQYPFDRATYFNRPSGRVGLIGCELFDDRS